MMSIPSVEKVPDGCIVSNGRTEHKMHSVSYKVYDQTVVSFQRRCKALDMPLVNKIFLIDNESAIPLQKLLQNIALEHMHEETGSNRKVLEKLEAMLQIVTVQRQPHLTRHPIMPKRQVFDECDMKEINNY